MSRAGSGPLTACLRFGVGWNDERLAEHGITHAVEHLALRPVGPTPYSWNGMVDAVTTNFSVTGSPDEVASHLATICRTLADLPATGLSNELSVMQVEAAKRSPSHVATDLGIRFGARGPGLVDWSELGFRRLTAADLQAWSDRWFTAANAVLWISGPPPGSLDLPLPVGQPPDHPVHVSRLGPGRFWVPSATSSVSVSTVNDADQGPAARYLGRARTRLRPAQNQACRQLQRVGHRPADQPHRFAAAPTGRWSARCRQPHSEFDNRFIRRAHPRRSHPVRDSSCCKTGCGEPSSQTEAATGGSTGVRVDSCSDGTSAPLRKSRNRCGPLRRPWSPTRSRPAWRNWSPSVQRSSAALYPDGPSRPGGRTTR